MEFDGGAHQLPITVTTKTTSKTSSFGAEGKESGQNIIRRQGFFDSNSVFTHLEKVFVILELATASDPVEFLRRPMRLRIRTIRRITGPDSREDSVRSMKVLSYFITRHRGKQANLWSAIVG